MKTTQPEKEIRIFDFIEKDGKFFPRISGKTAYYFFSTHGIPLEMYIEETKANIARMRGDELTAMIMHDLELWKRDNNIITEWTDDIESIK